MHQTFQQSFYIPGTWAANHTLIFKAPSDLQLIHVSAANTSANAGQIKLGYTGSDAAYMALKNFGVSSAAAEYGRADFTNGEYPHIARGTTVVITLNDHASHMANGTVALTFAEG